MKARRGRLTERHDLDFFFFFPIVMVTRRKVSFVWIGMNVCRREQPLNERSLESHDKPQGIDSICIDGSYSTLLFLFLFCSVYMVLQST